MIVRTFRGRSLLSVMMLWPVLTCFTPTRVRMMQRLPANAVAQRITPLVLCSRNHSRASADQLVGCLEKLVSQHSQRPWTMDELHAQLARLTADAAAAVASGASEGCEEGDVLAMTVSQLRAQLSSRNLRTSGLKAELRERLLEAIREGAKRTTASRATSEREARQEPAAGWLEGMRLSASTHASVQQLLQRPGIGPQVGVFTDGSCVPNPGPGGWAALCVDGEGVLWAEKGHADQTTNNRMEMLAVSLIALPTPNV